MLDHTKALDYARQLQTHYSDKGCVTVYDAEQFNLAQAYLDLHQRMQWQPIEIAPRDGTEVLTFEPTCHYRVASKDGEDSQWYNGDVFIEPTLWMPIMPLPTPPKESE